MVFVYGFDFGPFLVYDFNMIFYGFLMFFFFFNENKRFFYDVFFLCFFMVEFMVFLWSILWFFFCFLIILNDFPIVLQVFWGYLFMHFFK